MSMSKMQGFSPPRGIFNSIPLLIAICLQVVILWNSYRHKSFSILRKTHVKSTISLPLKSCDVLGSDWKKERQGGEVTIDNLY